MTEEFDIRIGKALDRALEQQLGLKFDPNFHPGAAVARKKRRWQWSMGSVAAAAGIFAVAMPVLNTIHLGKVSSANKTLAAYSVSKSVKATLGKLGASKGWSVNGMSPIYATYPMAVPTGRSMSLSGHFKVGQVVGTSLALQLNNQQHVVGGTLFNAGIPVYTFRGDIPGEGQSIHSQAHVPALQGNWINGTPTSIDSFAAAGPNIYLTHGNTWTVMSGQSTSYWAKAPGTSTVATTDTISALPSNPNQALLVEENPSGQSMGYVTTDKGRHWTPWSLGYKTVSNVVGMNHEFWAIINGTLMTSQNGSRWTSLMGLNTNRWQVEDYAIDPANPHTIAAALVPVSGNGIGPVLETMNNGATWSRVPNFPALGAAPASMVMSPTGAISALVNLTDPVLVRYSDTRQKWMILPVPGQNNNIGIGQLAATIKGDLIYGAPGGYLYQWTKATKTWGVITPPKGTTSNTAPATPLETIGESQVLAGYNTGWYIFVKSPQTSSTPKPATHS